MMKKPFLIAVSLMMVIAIALSACSILSSSDVIQDEPSDQTLPEAVTEEAPANEEPETEPVEVETQAPTAEPEVVEVVAEEATEAVEEAETEAPAEIVHTMLPGEPSALIKSFTDTNSALTASGGYVTAGDDFTANLFERPFSENEMFYFSDLDIQKAEIAQDENFYYVTITVDSYHPDGGLQAGYGVEIDEDRDGRGDLLIVVDRPFSTAWDIAGVTVRRDANNDVGGSKIMRPDTGYTGDSYEQVLFSVDVLDDPDMAWARVTDAQHPQVTIAFKKSIVSSSTFLWGVWAADSLLELVTLDIHDYFTAEEAGSPNPSMSTFPLKAVNLVDNTCRETFGFTATAPLPGLCPLPIQPTAVSPGSISGFVFYDGNNSGSYEATADLPRTSGFTVTLHSGSCSGSQIASSGSTNFKFSGLAAGTYCVKISPSVVLSTSNAYTVNLSEGQSRGNILFGYTVN
jgi:hypothetical protein